MFQCISIVNLILLDNSIAAGTKNTEIWYETCKKNSPVMKMLHIILRIMTNDFHEWVLDIISSKKNKVNRPSHLNDPFTLALPFLGTAFSRQNALPSQTFNRINQSRPTWIVVVHSWFPICWFREPAIQSSNFPLKHTRGCVIVCVFELISFLL